MASRKPAPAPRKRKLSLLIAGLATALALYVAWQIVTWPNVAALAAENPKSTSFIDRYWARQPASKRPKGDRVRWASYGNISPNLKRAVLVSEDINFFSHDGFDRGEIRKAIDEAREKNESPRGASTITQQLAKNLWLSAARTPLRKIKEAILAKQLERSLGKRRILEIYLNVVEFGPGIFGVGAASQAYFGKLPGDLSEFEAAQLAAGLPKPSMWHPGSTSKTYERRVERVMRRMEKAGFLWKVI